MYIYLITNLINQKQYVGQTNNFNRRMIEHRNNSNMLIDQKIQEYGQNNFTYQIIYESDDIQDINEKERYYIKLYNTLVPNGYNIQPGGLNYSIGEWNNNATLTEQEAQWILDHRDIPIKELYMQSNLKSKISYTEFKAIYNNAKWSHLQTNVDKHNNLSHPGEQSGLAKYTDKEVYDIREDFKNGVYFKKAWEKSGCKTTLDSFYNIYIGHGYSTVHMDVYTEENKQKHKPDHSGENNGRAKLTKENVIKIRELAKEKSISEIYKLYPQVSKVSIRNVINYKTWKNV